VPKGNQPEGPAFGEGMKREGGIGKEGKGPRKRPLNEKITTK